MKSDKIYEKETGKSAWIMYAHTAGPTVEFLKWLDNAALKQTDIAQELIVLSTDIDMLAKRVYEISQRLER